MEVILLIAAGCIVYSIYLHYKNYNLNQENNNLGNTVSSYIIDYERALEDHKAAETELRVTQAKLDGLEKSTLTPDNAVPKELHVEKVIELSNNLQATKENLDSMTEKFEEVRGKQISERVRLGQVGENFAAFHTQFPYNRKNAKALFQPVDMICFEDDEVIFIDVKTGNSKLNKVQRKIRDNIKNGRVRFEIHRINKDGYTVEDK